MFEIIVDEDILFDSAGESYTCGYWCRTEHGDFPCESWTDFAGILIFEWSQAIMSACRFPDAQFCLRFLDGPYEITGHRMNEKIEMNFYRNANRGRVLTYRESISVPELANAMYKAVLHLKTVLYLKGYQNSGMELDKLIGQWRMILQQFDDRKMHV